MLSFRIRNQLFRAKILRSQICWQIYGQKGIDIKTGVKVSGLEITDDKGCLI